MAKVSKEECIPLVDKLFKFIPTEDHFEMHDVVNKSDLRDEDRDNAWDSRDNIVSFLYTNGYLRDRKSVTLGWLLNDQGKKAKSMGGHTAYQQFIQEENELKNKAFRLDLRQKEFIYKYRWLPYIFSFVALIVSLVGMSISIRTCNLTTESKASLKPTKLPLPMPKGDSAKKTVYQKASPK